MSKAEIVAQLRSASDALVTSFHQIRPKEWVLVTDYQSLSYHDLLNYAMAYYELTGNWYLQSLRMEPAMNTAAIEAEALRHVTRRRERIVTSDLADFMAAKQNLLILLDMAQEAQLAEVVVGRTRVQQFADLVRIVQLVTHQLQSSLTVLRAGQS